ncbi:hypothetical protein P9112_013501 [Eukaryota sp. TZLM1-RC]
MSQALLSDINHFLSKWKKDLRSPHDFFRKFDWPNGNLKNIIHNNVQFFWSNYVLLLVVCTIIVIVKNPVVFALLGLSIGMFIYFQATVHHHLYTMGQFRVYPQHLVLIVSFVLAMFVNNKLKALFSVIRWLGFGSLLCLVHSFFYKSSMGKRVSEIRSGIM